MEKDRNLGGDSNVTAYDYGDDWIHVQFRDRSTYEYKAATIGQAQIDAMKSMADSEHGLNTHIMTNRRIAKGYSRKW